VKIRKSFLRGKGLEIEQRGEEDEGNVSGAGTELGNKEKRKTRARHDQKLVCGLFFFFFGFSFLVNWREWRLPHLVSDFFVIFFIPGEAFSDHSSMMPAAGERRKV